MPYDEIDPIDEEVMEIIIGKRTARIYDHDRAKEIIDEITEQFKGYAKKKGKGSK